MKKAGKASAHSRVVRTYQEKQRRAEIDAVKTHRPVFNLDKAWEKKRGMRQGSEPEPYVTFHGLSKLLILNW